MPVFITAVAVAVVLLVVYIVMLARPVSYGMKYTYKNTKDNMTVEATYKFKSDKIVNVETKIDGKVFEDSTGEAWILRNGNQFTIIGMKSGEDAMTEEEYNARVKSLKDSEQWDAFWNGKLEGMKPYKVSTFKLSMGEDMFGGEANLTCSGAIVFAVVMGVVEALVIAFAATSTTFFILDKKNAQSKEQPAA